VLRSIELHGLSPLFTRVRGKAISRKFAVASFAHVERLDRCSTLRAGGKPQPVV
jgi:hypothetical protein